MKHLFSLTLIALLLTLLLVACTQDTPPAVTDEVTAAPTEEPTAAPTEAPTTPVTEAPTEAPTEPVTEPETLNFDGYTATPADVLLYNTSESPSSGWVTDDISIGAHIKVAADCVLSDLTFMVPGRTLYTGKMEMHFYRWDTDYETTVAAAPVGVTVIEKAVSGSWVTAKAPAMTVGEGEWLVLFCNGSGDTVGINITNILRQADADAGVTVIDGYRNGKTHRRAPALYATYTRYTAGGAAVEPQPFTTLTPGKAHVIIISGQSNAAGQSLVSLLEKSASPEAWARYEAGYPNVLIDSATNGGANETRGFVPTRLGLGASTATYGPEVGLADYLSRTYPDETFYIIKAAWSGAGLSKHFQDHNGEYKYIRGYITAALDRLEAQGLEPEVFAFCWMQGETDSFSLDESLCYAERQDDLIARLTTVLDGHVAPGGFAFLDAQISTSPVWTFAGLVNRQKQLCDDMSPNRYYLDTNTPDIDCRDENNDIAHYDSDDMIELGELYGQYIKTVLDNAGWTGD